MPLQHKRSRKQKVTRFILWCGFAAGQTGPAANPVLIIVVFQWLSLHCLIICANPFDCCVKWATPKSLDRIFHPNHKIATSLLEIFQLLHRLLLHYVPNFLEIMGLVNGVSGRSGQTDQSAVGMDFGQNSAGLLISNQWSVLVVSIDMRTERVCWRRAALGLLNCQSPGWKGKSQVSSDQWSIMHQLRQFCGSHEVSSIEA